MCIELNCKAAWLFPSFDVVSGPHVNSHHQSLIMATVWITGRGNVGYGANIGSNHTGRLADQECWAGEGTFWGLSNVAKFPINLTHSPYSIVAAGVQFMPQRVCMPFSLFTDYSATRGNAIISGNQCLPGWILLHSAYTIARSEHKFSTRTKAKRHQHYTGWKIVRPGIVDLCLRARSALQGVNSNPNRQFYFSDKDIDGLGMCHLTEAARQDGIKIYTQFVQRYALRGLLEKLSAAYKVLIQSGGSLASNVSLQDKLDLATLLQRGTVRPTTQVSEAPVLPWDEKSFRNSDELWKHQISILSIEFPGAFPINAPGTSPLRINSNALQPLLKRLIQLEAQFSKMVEQSKEKDNIRGVKIIPKYADVHDKAEDDKTVILVRQEAQRIEETINVMLQDNWPTLSHL